VASVFLKRRTWYLKIQDVSGRWVARPSKARNKTEAKGLAAELEAQVDRQRKGLEPLELPDGGGTLDELMVWWIEKFLRKAGSSTGESSIRKHIIGSPLGRLRLTNITPGKVDLFLTEKEDGLSARSVNHLRGYLSRAFTMARRMEKFPRANPVADVPKRKVVKRLPDYLRATEVPQLLAVLSPKWKALFATALYTGMRKGELFALQKADVDFDAGLIIVSRSHDRDIPKGGRAEAIPINAELVNYLNRAITASPSELVFPDEVGNMRPKHTALEDVLRRAMRRAGIVTGYVHKCRRHGCGHREPAADANPRRCPKCNFKLFPVGEVRKLRFHHLRHTTASLLLMQGADLAAVQRIMRHQDPRITTEVYGHLAPGYLKKEIDRLRFEPLPTRPSDAGAAGFQAPAAAAASAAGSGPSNGPSDHAAGGASEPPQPAATATVLRLAAPFGTHLVPAPPITHAPSTRRGRIGKDPRGVELSGREDLNLRPFGPEPNALPDCATPRA
jgi:integrase